MVGAGGREEGRESCEGVGLASPGAEDGQGGVSETRPERCLTAYARPRPSGLSVAPAAASHFGLFIVVEEMAWRRTGDPSPGKGGGKQPNKQIEAAVHVYARLPRVETCSRRCLVAGGRGGGRGVRQETTYFSSSRERKKRKKRRTRYNTGVLSSIPRPSTPRLRRESRSRLFS